MTEENLLEIRDLKVHFEIKGGILKRTVGVVQAVDGVDLDIRRGEILGLVGESGCGKTTVGRAILRLVEATSGSVKFKGRDIFKLSAGEMKPLRKEMQLVFQDPYSSLDPRSKVGDIVGEGLRVTASPIAGALPPRARSARDGGAAEPHIRRFPMNSPAGSASVLASRGRWWSSPASSCVTSRCQRWTCRSVSGAQLAQDLQQELDLTLLFIAHDMSVVEHLCNRVAVMYLGKIVEVASRGVQQSAAPTPRR